ncbi:MAG: DUF1461 domain-containing protein, partial [Oscillospiraceae bacterium]|nr:DUF1461 domain-containing protein [Oscillospiraceae bacterium]
MTKQILPRVWEIAAAAALALFLISSSVLFTLNFRPLYYAEIGPLNIPERSGLTEDEIRANYDAVIDYLSITGPDELVLPTLPMSENGRVHFEEVKQIFVKLEVIFALSLAATVFFVLRALRKSKDPGATPGKNNYRFLRIGAIISVALPSAIGII